MMKCLESRIWLTVLMCLPLLAWVTAATGPGFTDLSLFAPSNSDYSLALEESNGFFRDVAAKDWVRMKRRYKDAPKIVTDSAPPHIWYQNNFEPTFTCLHEVRLGGNGDGPKWVCDPHRIDPNNCLVYSIGSNNNFMFEESVLRDISPACEIHTFDPTIGDHPSRKPKEVQFHPWGLASESGTSHIRRHNRKKYNATMKSMESIIKVLKHENRTVDVFKFDCEDCEWTTVHGWFPAVPHRQIQGELHGGTQNGNAAQFMTFLQAKGYVAFHKESNTLGCKGDCIEYSFLHLNSTFISQ
jgi:hypothetical protein